VTDPGLSSIGDVVDRLVASGEEIGAVWGELERLL
jgi:hypothetical protein